MINAAKQSNLNGSNIDIQHITFDQSEEPCSSIPRSELGQRTNPLTRERAAREGRASGTDGVTG
jgi:hypothetical protein